MADVYGVWLRDDAVIMSGTDKSGTAQLIVSDVETGERRWSLRHGLADLSGGRGASWWGYDVMVVGDGADWSVLVTYIADDADRTSEFGLAALSGEDGHVLWMAPAIPAVPFESEAAEANESLDVALTAASDQLAVLTVAPSDAINGLRRVRPDTVRAVAIDATTGRQRWKRTGWWPQGVAGDMVIGKIAPTFSDWPPLDVSDLILVNAGAKRAQILNGVSAIAPETGVELAQFDAAEPPFGPDCRSDGILVGCVSADVDSTRLTTYAGGEDPVTVELPAEAGRVDGIWRGNVFVSETLGDSYSVDRHGNLLVHRLPGHFEAITGRYALFAYDRSNGLSPEYAVHRAAVPSG